jgi:hypothetical protein
MLGKLEAGAVAEVPTASLMDQLGLGRPIQKKSTPRLRLAKSQPGPAGKTGNRKAGQKKAEKKAGKNAAHHRRKPPRHKA